MKVKIEKIVNGGFSLARTAKGVILVPFGVPGDTVDIEYTPDEGVSMAWIKKVVVPSPHRRPPRCPVFGICGGCDFDNIEYGFELEVKAGILIEDLGRFGGIDSALIDETIASPEKGYRNHAQFKIDAHGNVGFFAKRSHQVVPIPKEGCRLLQKDINSFVAQVRETASLEQGGFRVRADTDGNVYHKGIPQYRDHTVCYYSVEGIRFRVGIDDFFQVNSFVVARWLGKIISYLDPRPDDEVLDLFCGAGLITLHLAGLVRAVTGVEINRNAVLNARGNAELNSVMNARFVRAAAVKGIHCAPDAKKVVLDPPRTGLGEDLVERIALRKPEVIVYASCDTATFSRDVLYFSGHGYTLEKVSVIDMFPRTRHIEVVARLGRRT
jgi:23S rRNA (uracil1939-C5)-methyltransferase